MSEDNSSVDGATLATTGMTRGSSFSRSSRTESIISEEDSSLDVLENFRSVDLLIESALSNGRKLEPLWPEIWEKLHAFKGDLVSLNDSHCVVAIASKINNMRGSCLPATFLSNYTSLRALVKRLESANDENEI